MERIIHTLFILIICVFLSSCGHKTEPININAATVAESNLDFLNTVFLQTGKFVDQQGLRPDKNSKEFYLIQETRLKDIKTLNHLNFQEGARSVKIVGLHLEIGPKLATEIYEIIHNKDDIKRLEIDAETIVFKSSIHLPQTDVIIRAKNLFFEGDTKIDTSPRPFHIPVSKFQNGKNGLDAGNFEIYVESIVSSHLTTTAKRFVSTGGQGQNAGPGQAGFDGSDASTRSNPICVMGYPDKKCWIEDERDHSRIKIKMCNDRELKVVEGENCTCPTSGAHAIAGGRPGTGGKASMIISNIPLEEMESYFSSTNGIPGESAGTFKGGQAGLPREALIQIQAGYETHHPARQEYCSTTLPGTDAHSPVLIASIVKGEIKPVDYLEAMSHSLYSTFKLKFANELFSQGYGEDAKKEYSEIVNFVRTFSPQEKSDILSQTKMLALQKLYNLELNLDYFGHSKSWMPGLDLNTNGSLYQSQIDDYLAMLYLSAWVQNREASLNAQKDARKAAVEKFYAQLENGYAATTKIFIEVPKIKGDLEEISRNEKFLLARIEELNKEIEQTAQANVEHQQRKKKTKRILLGLAALAKSIPAGQPALGGAGSIIEAVLRAQDSDDGYARLKEIPTLLESVVAVTRLRQSKEDWNGNYKKISFENFQSMSSEERSAYLESI
ncbi:MAG: hypothetical protein AABY86_16885, partial [Bdellovibrionota bacterium]